MINDALFSFVDFVEKSFNFIRTQEVFIFFFVCKVDNVYLTLLWFNDNVGVVHYLFNVFIVWHLHTFCDKAFLCYVKYIVGFLHLRFTFLTRWSVLVGMIKVNHQSFSYETTLLVELFEKNRCFCHARCNSNAIFSCRPYFAKIVYFKCYVMLSVMSSLFFKLC